MSDLTVSNLAKSYGPDDIFEGVSCGIPHGAKIALVGPNGSGKTTLLRAIAGLEEPTAGTIHRAKGLDVGYLPQQADFSGTGTLWEAMLEVFTDLRSQAAELRCLESRMADSEARDEVLARYGSALEAFELAGGYTYERRIKQVLSGLGFDESDFRCPVAQLSGGQKTRALLARLLLEEPDLLLLDEPTNHLDLAGVEWLEDYLKAWEGAVVVVAHDRAFLDAVVERVWELTWGRLERYRGDYSAYVVQKAERLAFQNTSYERQQRLVAQTEDFIQRNIAGQRGAEAKGRQKRLARMERIGRAREYRPMALNLGDAARSGDLVLGLYDVAVGYDPSGILFMVKEVELRRGQRVALLGPNGSGKTTLVRTILDQVRPLEGRVRTGAGVHLGYFAQGHVGLPLEKTVIQAVLDASDLLVGEARSLLGRHRFSGDDVFKRVSDLSGGEQARVALVLLTLQGANVLILDEPTNHLDIPSQEVLQEALAEFGGTLLMVSHDRYLIRRLATCVWAIEDGQLWEFTEGYEQYHSWEMQRRQQGMACEESVDCSNPSVKSERERAREARRVSERAAARRIHRQVELEQTIHRLEARLAHLEGQLAVASEQKAVDRVRQLGVEYGQVEMELNTVLAAWADMG
jgi:ATP-binding cassette subfamily F protein 3